MSTFLHVTRNAKNIILVGCKRGIRDPQVVIQNRRDYMKLTSPTVATNADLKSIRWLEAEVDMLCLKSMLRTELLKSL